MVRLTDSAYKALPPDNEQPTPSLLSRAYKNKMFAINLLFLHTLLHENAICLTSHKNITNSTSIMPSDLH